MNNPFFFGKAITGEHFVNRKNELREILSHLTRGQNVILYSPRRYGKTSLIKTALIELKKHNFELFYFDLYRISSIEEFYRSYSQLIFSQIKSPVQKVLSLLQSLLPSLHPRIVFEQPDSPTLEIDVSLPVLKDSATLKELLDSLEKYLKTKRKRGCVVFDEFQEILSIEDGEKLEREMRSAFQHHRHVSYAFLGSRNHLMHGLFKDKSRPFYNFGVHYPLDVISEEHWTPYIIKQFRKGGYSITKELCKKITGITKGHPYHTQLFCSELWELYSDNKKLQEKCIEETLVVVLQKESHAFQEVWDGLKSRERKVINAITLENPAVVFSKDFLTKYHFGTQSSIQRTINNLIKKDLIVKDENGYYIVNEPIFEQWLRRKE